MVLDGGRLHFGVLVVIVFSELIGALPFLHSRQEFTFTIQGTRIRSGTRSRWPWPQEKRSQEKRGDQCP